eukprot:973633-Rhodomonas_salina.1
MLACRKVSPPLMAHPRSLSRIHLHNSNGTQPNPKKDSFPLKLCVVGRYWIWIGAAGEGNLVTSRSAGGVQGHSAD